METTLRDFVMADNVLHTTLPRPKKPKKPTKRASAQAWQKYASALATHEQSMKVYREAAALRRKQQVQRAGQKRGKRPAAANDARMAQQEVNRQGQRERRAVAVILSADCAPGSYPDWPTRLLASHEKLQHRRLEPPADLQRVICACSSVGAKVELLCARTSTLSGRPAPVVLLTHGTTLSSAMVIYERGFTFSLQGRAVPPGVRVPARSTGAVCFGAAVETSLCFAKPDGCGHGALVVASAQLDPEHYAISACSGGTVVAFDTAVAAGLLVVVAVLKLERPVSRSGLNLHLRTGRSSTNKAEWEQRSCFTSEFDRLLTHVGETPEGWQLDERYTWRSGFVLYRRMTARVAAGGETAT